MAAVRTNPVSRLTMLPTAMIAPLRATEAPASLATKGCSAVAAEAASTG
jgi:hypothetical protein